MKIFEERKLYTPAQREAISGCPLQTQANERSGGYGPRFIKKGTKVLYLGEDLNEYFKGLVVEPNAVRENRTRIENRRQAEKVAHRRRKTVGSQG